jgi:hypothetical protein
MTHPGDMHEKWSDPMTWDASYVVRWDEPTGEPNSFTGSINECHALRLKLTERYILSEFELLGVIDDDTDNPDAGVPSSD